MVCFEKQLATRWYRIYKCILDLGLKLQGKADFIRATAATAVARLSHHNSVCLSVRLSVTRVDQAKTVQARISQVFTIGCLEDSSFRNRKAFS